MKYNLGQTVTLLDTYYKPAGSAVVVSYEEMTNRYEVDFRYPGSKETDQLCIPEERLILQTGFAEKDIMPG